MAPIIYVQLPKPGACNDHNSRRLKTRRELLFEDVCGSISTSPSASPCGSCGSGARAGNHQQRAVLPLVPVLSTERVELRHLLGDRGEDPVSIRMCSNEGLGAPGPVEDVQFTQATVQLNTLARQLSLAELAIKAATEEAQAQQNKANEAILAKCESDKELNALRDENYQTMTKLEKLEEENKQLTTQLDHKQETVQANKECHELEEKVKRLENDRKSAEERAVWCMCAMEEVVAARAEAEASAARAAAALAEAANASARVHTNENTLVRHMDALLSKHEARMVANLEQAVRGASRQTSSPKIVTPPSHGGYSQDLKGQGQDLEAELTNVSTALINLRRMREEERAQKELQIHEHKQMVETLRKVQMDKSTLEASLSQKERQADELARQQLLAQNELEQHRADKEAMMSECTAAKEELASVREKHAELERLHLEGQTNLLADLDTSKTKVAEQLKTIQQLTSQLSSETKRREEMETARDAQAARNRELLDEAKTRTVEEEKRMSETEHLRARLMSVEDDCSYLSHELERCGVLLRDCRFARELVKNDLANAEASISMKDAQLENLKLSHQMSVEEMKKKLDCALKREEAAETKLAAAHTEHRKLKQKYEASEQSTLDGLSKLSCAEEELCQVSRRLEDLLVTLEGEKEAAKKYRKLHEAALEQTSALHLKCEKLQAENMEMVEQVKRANSQRVIAEKAWAAWSIELSSSPARSNKRSRSLALEDRLDLPHSGKKQTLGKTVQPLLPTSHKGPQAVLRTVSWPPPGGDLEAMLAVAVQAESKVKVSPNCGNQREANISPFSATAKSLNTGRMLPAADTQATDRNESNVQGDSEGIAPVNESAAGVTAGVQVAPGLGEVPMGQDMRPRHQAEARLDGVTSPTDSDGGVSAWLEETQKQLSKVSCAVATVLAATENAVHAKKVLGDSRDDQTDAEALVMQHYEELKAAAVQESKAEWLAEATMILQAAQKAGTSKSNDTSLSYSPVDIQSDIEEHCATRSDSRTSEQSSSSMPQIELGPADDHAAPLTDDTVSTSADQCDTDLTNLVSSGVAKVEGGEATEDRNRDRWRRNEVGEVAMANKSNQGVTKLEKHGQTKGNSKKKKRLFPKSWRKMMSGSSNKGA